MTTVTTSPIVSPPEKTPYPRMTYEEWLAWEHEGGLSEWVNGEVIPHMTASALHQRIVVFLTVLLQTFVQLHKLGQVLTGPAAMRARPDGNAREPDLFFVSAANLGRLTDKALNGPADLVVEVVSDDSVARDLDEKKYEYEQVGVREYWIIDPRPNRQRAYFYVLDAKGHYQPVIVGDDGLYHSTVLPLFWFKIDWLWADEPNALAALAQIVGAEKLMAAIQGNT